MDGVDCQTGNDYREDTADLDYDGDGECSDEEMGDYEYGWNQQSDQQQERETDSCPWCWIGCDGSN